MHAIVTADCRNKYKRVCVCVCVCLVRVKKRKKLIETVGDLSASSSFGPTDTHSGFVHGITDHDAPSLVVYFWE